MSQAWLELAHDKNIYLYPTTLYWLSAQYACKEVGVKKNVIGCWYRNSEFSYLTTPGGLITAGKKILTRLEKNDFLLKKIETVNRIEIPIMLSAAKRLSGNLSSINGRELFARWNYWLQKFLSMMTYSVMATVMEMEEPLLSNVITSIIKGRLGKNHDIVGECVQILSSSPRETVAGKEERVLLILRKKQIRGQLSKKEIHNHTKKYSWIGFGYNGPAWNEENILQRLSSLPSSLPEVQILTKKKNDAPVVLTNKQRDIETALHLNRQERRLVHSIRTLGFWKFERKFRNQQAHLLMEDFIEEIAKRNQLSKKQVYMIAPDEMEAALVRREVDPDILNERMKESVVVFTGATYKVLSGPAARPVVKAIKSSLHVDPKIKEIRGTTAFPGKAHGTVRRVDEAQDMKKMKTGDILVSTSTNPQIIPAMKKALAIVTDSGGITSHAAIVSRELEIPCVIGTKIATKVFKDGDRVEVDASKGIIKKL